MGSDDIFKKKRQNRKVRVREVRDKNPKSFLIITEGTKTEKNYFDGFRNYILGFYKGKFDVPDINTKGIGRCTMSLIEYTNFLVNRESNNYGEVWVVFDKDDFADFDEAIKEAKKRGYYSAWTNESFEYWLYMHFYYCDSALKRELWLEKLSEIFKNNGIMEGYRKNNPEIFNICNKNDGLKNAIRNSKKINNKYSCNFKCSEKNPCSTVHLLIEKILHN